MKTKLALSILLLTLFFVFEKGKAQAPNWEWAKKIGGIKDEVISNISNDATGNIYAVGTFQSPEAFFGADTLFYTGTINKANLFIAKYDSSGNVLWEKNLGNGGTSQYSLINCAVDNNDDIYIAGFFNSPAIQIDTITLINTSTKMDMFIAKFDTAGNVLWAKSIGGMDDDNLHGLTTDDLGNFYITGVFESPALLFDTTLITIQSTSDFFVAKYDSYGNNIWATNFSGGGSNVYSRSKIAVDNLSNVIIGGEYQGALVINNDSLLPFSAQDAMIVKLDSNGIPLWVKSAGADGSDCINSIKVDDLGNIYGLGYFVKDSITFDNITLYNASTFLGNIEIFLVKYDEDGTLLWAETFPGTGSDKPIQLFLENIENIYLTGHFGSYGSNISTLIFGSTTLTSQGQSDIFIAKLDSAGNSQWAKSVGNVKSDLGYSVCVIPSGGIYVAGAFDSKKIVFDGIQLYNTDTVQNISDAYLAKIGSIVSTGIENIENTNDILLYPNPATDYLTINTTINKKQVITISDITGKIIYTTTTLSEKTIINTKDFPQGVYAVQVQAGDAVQTRKIVVTR